MPTPILLGPLKDIFAGIWAVPYPGQGAPPRHRRRASCYLAPYPSFNEEVSRISNLDQPAHRTSKEGKGPKHVGKAEAGKIS
jgi:hypothetical protein